MTTPTSVPTGLAAQIGGQPVARSGPATEVRDPRDLTTLATVTDATPEDVRRAVATAEAAWCDWRAVEGASRARALRAVAADLAAEAERLARLITAETGKVLAEARAEVGLSVRYLEWFASLAEADATSVSTGDALVRRVPIGVAAAVTTWNFPLSIPVRKLAAATAAGCTVVLKPSPLAPTTAYELVRIFERHLPPGVVGLVLGGIDQATALVTSDAVRVVTFTGSTAAGVDLATRLAPTLTRSVLELGGRAPVVVLPDADPAVAVETIMAAKLRNNGASCIAANNVFVHERVAGDVLPGLAERVRGLVPADPLLPTTQLGPLRTPEHARAIESLARDAEQRGCTVLRGPEPVSASECYARAVLVHADRPTTSWDSEVFGPLLQVRSYRDEDALVAEVNGWRRGLGGYLVTPDRDRAAALASRLRIGIVGVGTATPNSPELPFGGFDLAGWGREGATAGMDAFTEQQTVAYGHTGH
jgi:succinate-semialdehyde dehydrogenase/glutarate-semialdehyde dehydrogenase